MSAILLVAVPLLAAFLSILVKKLSPYILILVGLFNIVAILFFLTDGLVLIGVADQALGINLLLNLYSRIALLLINGLIVIIACLNIKEYGKFGTILLLAMVGLNGLVLTVDLFNFFVFLEISGIAAYLISSSNKKPRSTFHYLALGSVGSSLFLFGVIILYAMYGTLNMPAMIAAIQLNNNYKEVILPFTLMFIGLGVEAKLLPFNSWVKGVLGHSNTMSGPMIASVYAAAMSFVLGRFIDQLFLFEGSLLLVVTIILSVGILLGDMMAFSTKKVREILTFSSVGQASLVALLFVNGAVLWAVLLIIANALSKTVMFLVINKATKEVGSDETKALQGLFSNNLLVGLAFTLAALSVMGMPLLVGFTIKMGFLVALSNAGQIWLIVVILVAALIEGIYFVRLIVKLWYKGDNEISVKYGLTFKLVFVVFALALLVFGTYTAPINNLDVDSLNQMTEVVNNG